MKRKISLFDHPGASSLSREFAGFELVSPRKNKITKLEMYGAKGLSRKGGAKIYTKIDTQNTAFHLMHFKNHQRVHEKTLFLFSQVISILLGISQVLICIGVEFFFLVLKFVERVFSTFKSSSGCYHHNLAYFFSMAHSRHFFVTAAA